MNAMNQTAQRRLEHDLSSSSWLIVLESNLPVSTARATAPRTRTAPVRDRGARRRRSFTLAAFAR